MVILKCHLHGKQPQKSCRILSINCSYSPPRVSFSPICRAGSLKATHRSRLKTYDSETRKVLTMSTVMQKIKDIEDEVFCYLFLFPQLNPNSYILYATVNRRKYGRDASLWKYCFLSIFLYLGWKELPLPPVWKLWNAAPRHTIHVFVKTSYWTVNFFLLTVIFYEPSIIA